MNGELQVRGAANLPAPVAPAVPPIGLDDLDRIAKAVSASGLFGLSVPQVMTLMLMCQADGIHPIHAVRRFDIIKGKPSMKADAMLAEFQARGGIVQWVEYTEHRCEAYFRHPTLCPEGYRSVFTIEDAQRAGLSVETGGMYHKYPVDMLACRVISRGVRRVMPGVVVGIYTPEETADFAGAAPTIEARIADVPRVPPSRTAVTVATGSAPALSPPDRADGGAVNRILDLFHRLDIKADEQAMILVKRGAVRWSDLTKGQAAELIGTLEELIAEEGERSEIVAQAAQPSEASGFPWENEPAAEAGAGDAVPPNAAPADPVGDYFIETDAARPEGEGGPPRKSRKKTAAAAAE